MAGRLRSCRFALTHTRTQKCIWRGRRICEMDSDCSCCGGIALGIWYDKASYLIPFFLFLSQLDTMQMRRGIDLSRWWIEGLRPVGIVRSPIFTTLMQVSSRLLLVWGVVDNYPTATSPSPFYSSMLLAWSITEIIRYSYFMFNLIGNVPGYLTWLRYNTFYVLYPVGIISEMLLIFYASNTNISADNLWQQWGFRGILLAYVPGSFGSFQACHRETKKHPSAFG